MDEKELPNNTKPAEINLKALRDGYFNELFFRRHRDP